MARRDQTEETFQNAISLGKKNKSLFPEIRNWCRHLELKDVSAGLVAEMYGLPITIEVTCPHAQGGFSGAQLDWIAADFINSHCLNCTFHAEIHSPNFGTELLADREQKELEVKLATALKDETNRLVKERIKTLIDTERVAARITELSILQLIEGLNHETDKGDNATNLLEASKIDPDIFSTISLDALSLHFDDESVGALCIKTVYEVIKNQSSFPVSIFEQSIKALKTGRHFNDISLLLPFYITAENIPAHQEVIENLLDYLDYGRDITDPYDRDRDYKNTIDALLVFIELDRTLIQSIFRNRLSSDNAADRVNTNYCLQEIIRIDSSFVEELSAEMVKSFNLQDDLQFDSADHAVAASLGKLIILAPNRIYPQIRAEINKLPPTGRRAALRLYRYLLNDTSLIKDNTPFSATLVTEMISTGSDQHEDKELRKELLDQLHGLRHETITLLAACFDSLLGWLLQAIDRESKFLWWLEEVKTKKTEELTTFNPLSGKSYWEISAEQNTLSREIDRLIDIICQIVAKGDKKNIATISRILTGLDSSSQTKAKTTFINIISKGVTDPFTLAQFIPSLYTYLFDAVEVKIRVAAMKFFNRVIDNYPKLINQTLLDVATLFLKDPEVEIRGLAIQLQASIVGNIPGSFNPDNLKTLVDCLADRYVYVHKTFARNCEVFFPTMSASQKMATILQLLNHIETYKENDTSYTLEIIQIVLRQTRDFPGIAEATVKNVLVPYCKSGDYYLAKESIQFLAEVKTVIKTLEDDWLLVVIELLSKIPPGFRTDMDWRAELFCEMYSLTYECVNRNLPIILSFIQSRTEKSGYDIIKLLEVLSYFELHGPVIGYVENMGAKFKKVKATEYLFNSSDIIKNFSAYEKSTENGVPEISYLKKINNVLQGK